MDLWECVQCVQTMCALHFDINNVVIITLIVSTECLQTSHKQHLQHIASYLGPPSASPKGL